MEHALRCNSLKCRKQLSDRALVTTCSHIFCTDCATRLGLTNNGIEGRRACPACSSPLMNPDDAVITNLNPSEDYKTSVLSGLSPSVIIECTSRAMSFWAYQTTQEIVYHEHLANALSERYSGLSLHLDKVMTEANTEVQNLQNKLNSVNSEYESTRKKNDELSQAYKDKHRKLLQTQELYDKLKQKALLGQVQDAAEDAIDSAFHGPSHTEEPILANNARGDSNMMHEASLPHRPIYTEGVSNPTSFAHNSIPSQHGAWFRPGMNQGDVAITPSTHRQRAGDLNNFGPSRASVHGLGAVSPRGGPNYRSPQGLSREHLSNGHRATPRFPAVGLSSGLKVGQGANILNNHPDPRARLRATHRPAPTPSAFGMRPPGFH